MYPNQWHLNNTGSQVTDAIAGADINAERAWDISTGTGVTIAVIDDGMERTHPDLIDNIFINAGEIPGNSLDDDGNGYVDDVSGWSFTANVRILQLVVMTSMVRRSLALQLARGITVLVLWVPHLTPRYCRSKYSMGLVCR